MKRLLIVLLVVSAYCTVSAAGYDYLVFKQADGTETSLPASKLKITFADGNAVAETPDGASTELPLSSLSSMYFSDRDVTSIQTAVGADDGERATVYSVTGVKVAEGVATSSLSGTLKQGVYIVKTKGKTYKMQVR